MEIKTRNVCNKGHYNLRKYNNFLRLDIQRGRLILILILFCIKVKQHSVVFG